MNKLAFMIIPLVLGTVFRCSEFNNDTNYGGHIYQARTTSLYSFEKEAEEEATSINDLLIGDINYYTVKEDELIIDGRDELIPYLTLKEYAKTYEHRFKEGVVSEVKSSSGTSVWTISVGEQLVFYCAYYYHYQTVRIGGNISSAFKEKEGSSSGLIYYQTKITTEQFNEFEIDSIQDFRVPYMEYFVKDNEGYYPLAYYDSFMSQYGGYYTFYSYKNFYQSSDPELFASSMILEDEKSVYDEATEFASNFKYMPQFLRDYNYNVLSIVFNCFYGLKNYKNYSIVERMLCGDTYYSFFDEDNVKRGQALADFVADLDDGHTGLYTNSKIWGEDAQLHHGRLWTERSALASALNLSRNAAIRDYLYKHATPEEQQEMDERPDRIYETTNVIYSEDQTFAMFTFNEFSVERKIDTPTEDTWENDTYLYFIHQFEAIKEANQNGANVHDVFIDISTNGGGYIIALLKVLALISDKNTAHLDMYDDSYKSLNRYYVSVDSNNDGLYNLDDVYGDDFNIHLLTSPYSFSCANAFAFMAQRLGFADIYGTKTGGGECAVAMALLPNGQYFQFSSPTHLGDSTYIESRDYYVFEGDECGAGPDHSLKTISYNYFYNIDYLENRIKLIETPDY